jgi:hypothetical protein
MDEVTAELSANHELFQKTVPNLLRTGLCASDPQSEIKR